MLDTDLKHFEELQAKYQAKKQAYRATLKNPCINRTIGKQVELLKDAMKEYEQKLLSM